MSNQRVYEVHEDEEGDEALEFASFDPVKLSTIQKFAIQSVPVIVAGASSVDWPITLGMQFYTQDEDVVTLVPYETKRDVEYFCHLRVYGADMEVWFGGKHGGEYYIKLNGDDLKYAKSFSEKQYAEATKYWRSLTDKESREFWKYYTVGKGAGFHPGVDADTSFEDYNVISMLESEFCKRHDC